MELWHPKECLAPAVRIDNFVFHVFAAQMHVRHIVDQLHVPIKSVSRRNPVISGAGWDLEKVIRHREGNHSLCRRFFGKDEPDGGAIFLCRFHISVKA